MAQSQILVGRILVAPGSWICSCGKDNRKGTSSCRKCRTSFGEVREKALAKLARLHVRDRRRTRHNIWRCTCGTETDKSYCPYCGNPRVNGKKISPLALSSLEFEDRSIATS